jgi:hypothetical protein
MQSIGAYVGWVMVVFYFGHLAALFTEVVSAIVNPFPGSCMSVIE